MRRLERELITVFESSIDTVLGRIADSSMTVDEATRIAALPQTVRGFEERKIERPRPTGPNSPLRSDDQLMV